MRRPRVWRLTRPDSRAVRERENAFASSVLHGGGDSGAIRHDPSHENGQGTRAAGD